MPGISYIGCIGSSLICHWLAAVVSKCALKKLLLSCIMTVHGSYRAHPGGSLNIPGMSGTHASTWLKVNSPYWWISLPTPHPPPFSPTFCALKLEL